MKKPYAIRIEDSLREWLQTKADREERTVAITLERILREAQKREERVEQREVAP